MSTIDDILSKFNLKYDDLTSAERETLHSWSSVLENNQLTVESIRGFVFNLKYSIENELSRTGHESKEDIFLKARLRNIMLIEAFLTSPEKAKQALSQTIAGLVNNKK